MTSEEIRQKIKHHATAIFGIAADLGAELDAAAELRLKFEQLEAANAGLRNDVSSLRSRLKREQRRGAELRMALQDKEKL